MYKRIQIFDTKKKNTYEVNIENGCKNVSKFFKKYIILLDNIIIFKKGSNNEKGSWDDERKYFINISQVDFKYDYIIQYIPSLE